MKKVMLIYPPGEIYQRGEDRCQINVEASVSNSLRACNDLGYMAAILKKDNYEIFLKDYPAEKMSFENLKTDFENFSPDILIISTANGCVFDDIEIIKKLKSHNNTAFILKGALFFNPDESLYNEIDLSEIDYLIGGEIEFIIQKLLNAHFNNKEELKNIQGISYKEADIWKTNYVEYFNENIDDIPFPDRSLMNNNLYINPLTNKPMATISTSRGCPSSCIYCLSPVISGKKVRFRSPESIYKEIKECVEKYGIKDFFFKSDTFTIDKKWTIDVCNLITKSDLKGEINWVANSRTNTIDEELVIKMKEAGCSLIALGIESGSEESLKKMKKGTTVEQSKMAVKIIQKHKIQTFGFYLIGFPWEKEEHINQTKKLIYELNTDFIELSIATPFKGSELYKMVCQKAEKDINIIGKDSFKNITQGTDFVSAEYLKKIRKEIIMHYHLRPSYIMKKLFNKKMTFSLFKNYLKYGLRMLSNITGK